MDLSGQPRNSREARSVAAKPHELNHDLRNGTPCAQWDQRSDGPGENRTPVYAPLAVTVADAAASLCVSDDLVYELIRRGQLPCLHIGRRKVIPRRALELLVEHALLGFDPTHVAEMLSASRRRSDT